MAQNEAQMVYSTHDWNSTQTAPLSGWEAWADVKSPGDGKVYSVGTVTVQEVLAATVAGYFSLFPVEKSPNSWFPIPAGSNRQVVILQVVDENQAIQWQRYFYGFTPNQSDNGRENNSRAISVWPAAAPEDARVAICGASFDERLPLSQLGGSAPTGEVASGFVAVYDGLGVLLWTHQFYAAEPVGHCTITDLSVRVEMVEGVPHDVVTYCGMSTYGLVGAGPLAPVAPFTYVPGLNQTPGLGNTQNGPGQWDGFVGRLRRPAGGVTATDFHSIVGGSEQDSLYAIAELTEDRFVVTGATRSDAFTGVSPFTYPFTAAYDFSLLPTSTTWNDTAFYSVGVYSIFDASSLGSGLQLLESGWIGNIGGSQQSGEAVWTVGHDVAAVPYVGGFYIVGTTNDPGTNPSFLQTTQVAFGGAVAPGSKAAASWPDSDGFVLWRRAIGASDGTVGLFGSAYPDGINGVSMWCENLSYAAFCGWELPVAGLPDIRCGSLSGGGRAQSVLIGGNPGESVRELSVAVGSVEIPAAPGQRHVFNGTGVPFHAFDEPSAARSNGGIALDQRGRVNVVGHSFSSSYPFSIPNTGFPVGRAASVPIIAFDAVRSSIDMLPRGVSRTDGTGTGLAGDVPLAAASPYTGGTTPIGSCQVPYGWQLGLPLAEVNRLHIDYHGPAPANGVQASVTIEGSFGGSGLWVGALQIGFPGVGNAGAPYVPLTLPGSTVELWTVNNVTYLTPGLNDWGYQEYLLPSMASGSLKFSVQGVWALANPLSCDPGGVIATAGLVIDY